MVRNTKTIERRVPAENENTSKAAIEPHTHMSVINPEKLTRRIVYSPAYVQWELKTYSNCRICGKQMLYDRQIFDDIHISQDSKYEQPLRIILSRLGGNTAFELSWSNKISFTFED